MPYSKAFCSFDRAPEGRLVIGPDELHVFRLDVVKHRRRIPELMRLLSPEESERAAAFRYPRDCDEFIVVRGVLRLLLSRYLGLAPAEVRLSRNRWGKPGLAGAVTEDLRFNLSFSGNLALYAFTSGCEVGIDIEQMTRIPDYQRIAARFLAGDEFAYLRVTPSEMQEATFFGMWTLKEAVAKADGRGVFLPPPPDAPSPEERIGLCLFPGPDYAATVVLGEARPKVSCWEWRFDDDADGIAAPGFAASKEGVW